MKVKDIKFVALDKEALDCGEFGVRFSEDPYKMGDILPESYDWYQTEEMPEEDWDEALLDGTSTIGLKEYGFTSLDELKESIISQLKPADEYVGEYVYLVSGDCTEYGDDINECIIKDAKVIGILEIVK